MRTIIRALALGLLAMLPCALFAQRLSPDALARYQQQLPGAVQRAGRSPLGAYLASLQGRLPAVLRGQDQAAKDALALEIANAVRVANDLAAQPGAASLAHYTVPPMSDVMRLATTYPVDGTPGSAVHVVAAQGEYEGASFVLFPFENARNVEVKLSALTGPKGAVLPAANANLKVVKIWYQNGNRWYSYFSDTGLELVPELLLNDENLIRVDTAAKANYARIDYPTGTQYKWISPPRALDSNYTEHTWRSFLMFHPTAEPFADAPTLQPVELVAGQFKQFWLTVNPPQNSPAGIYRGTIALSSGGRTLAQIPVAVRVLPFALPDPKTNFDLDRDFLVTLYSCPMLSNLIEWNGADRALAERQLLAMMKNMRAHNLLHPMMNYKPGEMLKRHLELMKEAGLSTRPLIGNTTVPLGLGGDPLTYEQLTAAKKDAETWQKFFLDNLGHTDVYLGSGDEPSAAWVAKMRPAWKFYHERGLKIFTAGHEGMFLPGGYIYDMKPAAGFPEDAEKAKTWNTVGHAYVGFYAGQHNGSENPAFVRRQHGLLSYLSDFSMVCNYEFALGPWNDLPYDTYKPMALAYPTRDGLVDTIEWEGFREGIDDIRYATKLRQLAQEAIASGQLERVYEGRKVLEWFALLDGTTADLHAVRTEMIHSILHLMDLREAK